MSKRATRVQIAQETVSVLQRGHYVLATGTEVSIREPLASALSQSVLYAPDHFSDVFSRRDRILCEGGRRPPIAFEVVNETTLHAARRLVTTERISRVLALNFASAKNPGGGFLKGSQAQEESLARASGLYACIEPLREMYDANRHFRSCLYTDHMIYSPDVPVFRDDDDSLLDRPYQVSFVTAPAVNAGAVRANEPDNLGRLEAVMLARMEKLLSLAVVHGHEVLVLGAWGCGVFANDPERVAAWFARHLTGGGLFHTAFERVVFAVLDRTTQKSTIRPFQRLFAPPA